ncbi:hypothetical protein HBI57_206870 [Parastagonospora nodorum]|nr:hypothetical protein HBI79_209770 [Parastagonospora nodorum]KAH5238892.1 hypothetical protein HBI72_224680 [Parastagonospora nodorum]KAH6420823.1 hypothetical protein HBI14_080700 [Parastagonospora nodorum]KAH6447991.1 hypothetical protein HBI57_206870 [Parastagonospora nodorum]KAH6467195.1 hypothetical protein HBI58_168970 [Parastagonospora nodorum]
MESITVHIKNNTGSKLYAHVTGKDLEGTLFAVKADGRSIYHPNSPDKPLVDLEEDIGIAIDGSQRAIEVPQMTGGRIWFSKEEKLTFFRNPGPAFVEPAVQNVSDLNNNKQWGYCELTFDKKQLFANTTQIDFIGLPIAMELTTEKNGLKKVKGLPADGIKAICSKLEELGGGWEELIRRSASGEVLRVLGPNLGASLVPAFQNGYYAPYVDRVWGKYTSEDLVIDTQSALGVIKGRVKDGKLNFDGIASFEKPSTRDIFTCATGPFADGKDVSKDKLNIGARISAALNRSTLWSNPNQPHAEVIDNYYKDHITNHYARIFHEVSSDHLGYAFPYDDVHPSADGTSQEGAVNDEKPTIFQIIVGGE